MSEPSASPSVVRPPFVAGLLIGGWLSLLVAGGANAAWLFMALKRAGVQFASSDTRMLDAEETGRVLAGVLAAQLLLARTIADRALERTEALVSDDQPRATSARAALDSTHRASEAAYAVQTGLVALAALILAPRPRG